MTEMRLKKEFDLNIEAQFMHLEKIDAYRNKLLEKNDLTITDFNDSIKINEHRKEISLLQERNRLIDTYLTKIWKTKLKSQNSKRK